MVTETRERQRIVRFADEVEQSGGEGHSSKGAGTSSIQDFLLKMAGQPLPDKQVHMDYILDYQTINLLEQVVIMHDMLRCDPYCANPAYELYLHVHITYVNYLLTYPEKSLSRGSMLFQWG